MQILYGMTLTLDKSGFYCTTDMASPVKYFKIVLHFQ